MKGEIGILLSITLLLSLLGCRLDPNQLNQKNAAPEEKRADPHAGLGALQTPPVRGQNDAYFLSGSFTTGEGSYVRSLLADGDFVWVGTSEGVVRVARRSGEAVQTYTMSDGLKSPYIFTMKRDPRGVHWFGTNNGGLSRFDGKGWRTYLPSDGLADFWVYGIDFAADGTTWIATWNGVSRFDGTRFQNYHTEDGLANRWVYALAVDRDGSVWFGTEGGVNRRDPQGKWTTWRHQDGLGAPNKRGLAQSDNTGFGTLSKSEMNDYKHRHNLSILDSTGNETYNENYVFSMAIDREGNKWFGTWGGGAARFDGTAWKNYTTEEGLAGNIVYAITVDPADGAIWFGTNHGASRFDGTRWTNFTYRDGLANEHVYAVAVDADRHVWFGERGGVDEWAPKRQG